MTEKTSLDSLIRANPIFDPTPEEQERRRRLYVQVDRKLAAERQEDLDDLFHIDDTFAVTNPEEAARLKDEFLERKKGLNLGECFALSLQEPFFGRVHVVKLASTDHSQPDASLAMLHETNDFLRWLTGDGPLANLQPSEYDGDHISLAMGDDQVRDAVSNGQDPGDPIDRLKSRRWMTYEFFDGKGGDPDHQIAIIRRIRPFVIVDAEVNGELCSVKLYKETVFTVRASPFAGLLKRGGVAFGGDQGAVYDDEILASDHNVAPTETAGDEQPIDYLAMKYIERWLYTPDGAAPDIQLTRHYTAIYSAVVPYLAGTQTVRPYDS